MGLELPLTHDYNKSNELDIGMEAAENKLPDFFTLINANARSLTPKIATFTDCFKEMDSHIAVVTETWLWDGPELEDDVDDLLHGADDLHASEVLELTLDKLLHQETHKQSII